MQRLRLVWAKLISDQKQVPVLGQLLTKIIPPHGDKTSQGDKINKVISGTDRLKDALGKPTDEFRSTTMEREKQALRNSVQMMQRIVFGSMVSILQPTPLVILGSCFTIVFGLGVAEATYLLSTEYFAHYEQPDNRSLLFILEYAAENITASCIWETRPAALVARSLDLNPDEVRTMDN